MRSIAAKLFTAVVGLLLLGSVSCISPSHAGPAPSASGGMLLQIYFEVAADKTEAFEKMYADVYVPALRKQEGYIRSDLIRLFAKDAAKKIQAAPTAYNYQIELVFDSEENRVKWVASPEHQVAWPAASGLVRNAVWRGFDLVGEDVNH